MTVQEEITSKSGWFGPCRSQSKEDLKCSQSSFMHSLQCQEENGHGQLHSEEVWLQWVVATSMKTSPTHSSPKCRWTQPYPWGSWHLNLNWIISDDLGVKSYTRTLADRTFEGQETEEEQNGSHMLQEEQVHCEHFPWMRSSQWMLP